jgi:aminoglycoside phosphotransferase family enzyme/predicted kinase
LQHHSCFDHKTDQFQIIETHISWVLLTGSYAYKMKKAVDFGFLDYTTLEKRRAQCYEELRLNRRTAPEIYLEVVSIAGTPQRPVIGGEPAIEYLVKMRQFPQSALLSQQLAASALSDIQTVALAQMIARFHATIAIAETDSDYGSPAVVMAPIRENFTQSQARLDNPELIQRLQAVAQQAEQQFQLLQPQLVERKREGFIRDCHGDLHLNNIVLLNDTPLLFDCIEFNPRLRIIDVISEVAFLVMDLQEHGEPQRANLLLNGYLEASGDYAGVHLLRFYLCYRAMVRAKVATIRLDQDGIDAAEQHAVHDEFENYLQMAERYSKNGTPQIIITHGLSGSGKTTLTTPLMQQLGAIRIRSDIERKRLFGLAADEESGELNIYTSDANQRTYQQLATLATAIIEGGYPVIVDATFLKRSERDRFRTIAHALNVPFTILLFKASEETLHRRIKYRCQSGHDASEADLDVLKLQLEHYQPLDSDEMASAIVIDCESDNPVERVVTQLQAAH